jgi:zinc and cadmium transporter
MSNAGWLVAYCILILLFALVGGFLPFRGKVTHGKLQYYLSLSAGVMLGAAFFHIMPDAIEYSGPYFGWWMSLGVVGLFCIERFIAPHSHEINGRNKHQHEHAENGLEGALEHQHDHAHPSNDSGEHRAAAPAVAGWAAVFGLTLHTFMNGLGLAGSVSSGDVWWIFPGAAIFIAIVCHKPADALAVSTVLSRKGIPPRTIFWVLLGFVSMVPIGVITFYVVGQGLEEGARRQLIGAALAFSAGTFLFVALSDLLPEVQFHRHDRVPLFLCLALGVALMGGIALLEGHEHGGSDDHPHHASNKVDNNKDDHHRSKEGQHDGGDHDGKPKN